MFNNVQNCFSLPATLEADTPACAPVPQVIPSASDAATADDEESVSMVSDAADDADERITPAAVNIIKGTVYIVLEDIIYELMREACWGCEVDHPSQIKHSCAFDPDPDFLTAHFEMIAEKLLNLRLKCSLRKALIEAGLKPPSLERLVGAAETLFCELQSEPCCITQKLREIHERIDDQSCKEAVMHGVMYWRTTL